MYCMYSSNYNVGVLLVHQRLQIGSATECITKYIPMVIIFSVCFLFLTPENIQQLCFDLPRLKMQEVGHPLTH